MGVGVDEAGDNDHALGVDHALRLDRSVAVRPDIDDPIALYRNVECKCWIAAAIVNLAALNQHLCRQGADRGSGTGKD